MSDDSPNCSCDCPPKNPPDCGKATPGEALVGYPPSSCGVCAACGRPSGECGCPGQDESGCIEEATIASECSVIDEPCAGLGGGGTLGSAGARSRTRMGVVRRIVMTARINL